MKDVREALMVGRNSEGKLVRRPLSPHLGGYKLQISSVTSILHRITGVALGAGTVLLTLWLVSAAAGDGPFSIVQAFFASWVGRIILFGFTVALFYHFCNGIRHLTWDAGKGLRAADHASLRCLGVCRHHHPNGWLLGHIPFSSVNFMSNGPIIHIVRGPFRLTQLRPIWHKVRSFPT
jgi:succinate dehydrogenase / fumarate reductase cytochrome b subunit